MNISVVVPVFKGETTLIELVQRLGQVLSFTADSFEVILVNDASPDRSWEIIKDLSLEFTWVRGIDLARNYGQHNALLAGIRAALGDVIVTMDDDLQHPPEEIPALVAKLQEFDLVYGIPRISQHDGRRVIASKLMRWALATLGDPYASHRSSYRAFQARLREYFPSAYGSRVVIDTLLNAGSPRITSLPVHHAERHVGESNYTFLKLASLALIILGRLALRRLGIVRANKPRGAAQVIDRPVYVVRETIQRKAGEG